MGETGEDPGYVFAQDFCLVLLLLDAHHTSKGGCCVGSECVGFGLGGKVPKGRQRAGD